ncbi:MAG: flagellar biosynthetic protein FliO [Alphaproteobacteria bacterium]|nr:flagellar biosynthetic protein FliO [Alphaproteobacteria bacterium]
MTGSADFSWLRVFVAFSVVLGLMAGLGFVLKYISLRGFSLPTKQARLRRLQIVENLAVDTKRRFVIVRCDGREHLLLLGGEGDIVVEANLPSFSPSNNP